MSQDNTHTCGECVAMRESDGYCMRQGKYVNCLGEAQAKCFVSREEAAADPSAAPGKRLLTVHPTTKTCKDCGRELPLDAFGFHKSGTRKSVCRECQGARLKAARDAKAKKAVKVASCANKLAQDAKKVTPNANLTDAEMVALLREHGWVVTCTRTITEDL